MDFAGDEIARGIIDIRIARIESLFESLDPAPFHDRDLDPKAVDYILGWARECPDEVPITLRLHLSEADAAQAAADIGTAARAYFGYAAESTRRDLRELFRLGRRYLAIGLTVLTVCLLARRSIVAVWGDHPVAQLLAEGLAILGWVSNWKPIETFLYEWWPVRRQMQLYRRLAEANVEVWSASDAPLAPADPPSAA